jgi:hypothetical protein
LIQKKNGGAAEIAPPKVVKVSRKLKEEVRI